MKAFEIYNDSERMKVVFQQQLPEFSRGDIIISHCAVEYTRHGTSFKKRSSRASYLSIGYKLEVRDARHGKHGQQMLYGKVYPAGRGNLEFEKLQHSALVQPRFGKALVFLPEMNMIVWAFPNDSKMPHLPEVIDRGKVKQHLPYPALGQGLNGPGDLRDVTVEVIRYFPADRCTTRYLLQWGSPDAPRTMTIYGKTFKDERGQDICRGIAHLWGQCQGKAGPFTIAQPLGYSEAVKAIWQAALPGVPLMNLLNDAHYQPAIECVARGLAGFHEIRISRPKDGLNDRLKAIQIRIKEMIQTLPGFRRSLESIGWDIEKNIPREIQVSNKLIHGAFRINQLVVHEDQLGVFDLDDLAIGDPIQDLACLMADFYFHDFDPKLAKMMSTVLFNSYKERVDWDVPVDRLHWHMRIQFLNKAFFFYKREQLTPAFERNIQRVILLAQQWNCLGLC